MNFWLAIALIVVAAVLSGGIFAFVGFKLGEKYRRKVGEEKIGSAEQEAKRIVEEAQREAEATKKEAVISGKDEVIRERLQACILSDCRHSVVLIMKVISVSGIYCF